MTLFCNANVARGAATLTNHLSPLVVVPLSALGRLPAYDMIRKSDAVIEELLTEARCSLAKRSMVLRALQCVLLY